MFNICDIEDCTGCKLCSNVCPKKCISFEKNELGVEYPVINQEKCISCHLCKKSCPSNQNFDYKFPKNAYAAWSKNDATRNSSTSGGIAQELYEYALNNNYSVYGVSLEKIKNNKNDTYIYIYAT